MPETTPADWLAQARIWLAGFGPARNAMASRIVVGLMAEVGRLRARVAALEEDNDALVRESLEAPANG